MIKRDDKKQLKKFFFWGIVVILLFLSYIIIKSYIIPLISTFILSYLLLPIYKRLDKKIGKSLAAIVCVLLVLLIVIIPLGTIIAGITQQAYFTLGSDELSTVMDKISSINLIEKLNINLGALTEKGISFIITLLGSALSYLPSLLITLIIILFGIYYMLINWDYLLLELKEYLPFENKKQVGEEIKKSTNGLIYGSVLIAIIEFIIAIIGFYISGVSFYLLLPTLIFFLAFIPGLGPTVVWLPLALYYFLTGDYYTLIGVVITGVILSLAIDTILRPKLIGGKSNINPFIMLIGVLGGISVFGIFGFIIGPLILVYTLKIMQEVIKQK